MNKSSLRDNDVNYYEVKAVNNTSLRYFRESPLAFKEFFDNPEQDNKKWLDVGGAVHCLILEPELFDGNFVVKNFEKPQSPNQRKFCEHYKHMLEMGFEDIDLILHDSYCEAYKPKATREKNIEEAKVLYTSLEDYIQYLIASNEKVVLSTQQMDVVKKAVGSLRRNPRANPIVEIPDDEKARYTALNELEIYFDVGNVKCKSKIDRLIIDKEKFKIYIIDLKTTSALIKDFKESFVKYNYEQQFSFYCLAVYNYLEKQIKLPDLDKYEVECICAVVQTINNSESRIYSIPMERVMVEIIEIKRLLSELSWHFENNIWDYPRCYYEGEMYEQLDY